jgi:hypothetical protein
VDAYLKKEMEINSGIYGIVTIGPIKPVGKEGEINYKPYQATIIIKPEDGLTVIKRFTSNSDGTFKINLKPGKYVLEPLKTNNTFPIGKSTEVEVIQSQFTEINISFDTGIR